VISIGENYLNIWLDQFENKDEVLGTLYKLSNKINMPVEEIITHIDIISGYPELQYRILQELSDLYNPEISPPKREHFFYQKTNQVLQKSHGEKEIRTKIE
jgi:hypothetical protein